MYKKKKRRTAATPATGTGAKRESLADRKRREAEERRKKNARIRMDAQRELMERRQP